MPTAPYIWVGTLLDGSGDIREGESYEGRVILNPCQLPPGTLSEVRLTPRFPGWPEAEIAVPAGATVEYVKTRDIRFGATSGDTYVAVRFGIVHLDGTRNIRWLTPAGKSVKYPGTYEELLRAGILALLLCFALFLTGCRDESAPPSQTPATAWTAKGTPVVIPAWMEARIPTRVAEVLAEIDTEVIPAGWVVVVEVPVFVATYRDTRDASDVARPGLVTGLTDYDRMEIRVGWRSPCAPQTPLLPALSWEAANARHDAGHHDPFQGR